EPVVVVEAAANRDAIRASADVPLAHDRGLVALPPEHLRERHLREREPLLDDVLEARKRDQVGDPEVVGREEVLEEVVLEAVPRVALVRLDLVAEALLVAPR